MLIKIIWILIGINATALLVFIVMFMTGTPGRNVDTMEKGWMIILFSLGLGVVLLAAIPLRISHSTLSIFISAFFASLPLAIALGVLISKNLPSFKKKQSLAKMHYKDKKQLSIASAIEQNDTLLLSDLIKGQDLNIKGTSVWSREGLNYLQFTILLRSKTGIIPVNIKANTAAIRLLVEKGSSTTPALCDAVRYLPPETISILLDAGGDPNILSDITGEPLLFDAIGMQKQQNDIAILLVRKGSNVNAKNSYGLTPVMFAANNAQISKNWKDVWRVVHYLLEEASCDYLYTTTDGNSLQKIIRKIRENADSQGKTMPTNFIKVVEWLNHHDVDTEPANGMLPSQ